MSPREPDVILSASTPFLRKYLIAFSSILPVVLYINGKYWGKYYNDGGIIISGRYTTSNAVHQTSKLNESEWESFLSWLYDFEYEKVKIPRPDKVIFLDMPIDVSQKLLSGRYKGDENKKDIHEKDTEYLEKCRKAAYFTAKYSGWTVIPCAEDGSPRKIEDISKDILEEVLKVL